MSSFSAKLLEGLVGSQFSPPENFDAVHKDKEFTLYAGCNDWEAGHTAMAVEFGSSRRRVWAQIKHGVEPGVDLSKEQGAIIKQHGEEAVLAWLKKAREFHGHGGQMPWYEAFKSALRSVELQPFISVSGTDRQSWVQESAKAGDGFDLHRRALGAGKVDTFLATLGLGPNYRPTRPTVHVCPGCHKLGAVYKEIHADTDMNAMALVCPRCGYEAE